MNLNFTITELCHSDKAIEHGIKNIPSLAECDNLLNLIYFVLQPCRNKFGAIKVTSGYRNKEVNKLVNGAVNSNHLTGCAVDIIPLNAAFKEVYTYITQVLDYDECYIETNSKGVRWLHVAFRIKGNRFKHNPNYLT